MTVVRSVLFLFLGSFALVAPAGAQCPTPDDLAIQAAINDAASAGGSTVHLAARVYDICDPVVLRSHVHLKGMGIGATILRTRQQRVLSWPYASISGIQIRNASVTDLTLDHRTNGRVGNGIAFAPPNEDTSGPPPQNIRVAGNEVIGTPDREAHQYMIWNVRGQHVKIVDNWIDGGVTSSPEGQPIPKAEGIESFGGYDVQVHGNTVIGVSGSCFNFGSATGYPDAETVGLRVANNYGFYCHRGVSIGTGDTANQANAFSHIRDNVIIYAWLTGIEVSVGAATIERDLQISGNSIANVGGVPGGGWYAAGIAVYTRASSPATFVATTIRENHIENVTGAIAHGIGIDSAHAVRVIDNTVTGVSNVPGGLISDQADGICVSRSHNLEIRGNRVDGAGSRGIFLPAFVACGMGGGGAFGPSNATIVKDNRIVNWGSGFEGIRVERVRFGVVSDNTFLRTDGDRPPPLAITESCGVVTSDNVALYAGSGLGGTLRIPACQ